MNGFTKTRHGPLGTVPGMPTAQPHRKLPAPGRDWAHAFKGLQDWIEVFRVGTHQDSQGRETTFSADDLDQMAANVVGAGVPFVIGHPKEDDPAFAWAKPGDVKRDGDALLVKASSINPAFQAGVDSGAYRERSISIYKDKARGWVPRHIGWLGAAAPAIAGMAPLAYGAAAPADAELHEYSSMDAGWALGDVATLLRGLRDWLISKDGLDVANQVLPDWTITSVAAAATRVADDAMAGGHAPATAFTRPNTNTTTTATAGTGPHGDPSMTTSTFTQADIDNARRAAAQEVMQTEAAKYAAQGQELTELRAQRQAERIGVQINGWTASGLVLPAEVHGMAEFIAALEGGQAGEFKFGASDKAEAKKTPAQWFADFVAGRKALVKLGSNGTAGDPAAVPGLDLTDTQAIAKAAQNYVAEEARQGRVVDIASAVTHVTTAKPART